MQITQLRNATLVLEAAGHRLLVDPMLAPAGAIPALKYATRSRRRNPLVDLPASTDSALAGVSGALITHCQKGHFDHLDRAGSRWLRERAVPVWCAPDDQAFLRRRGLNANAISAEGEQTCWGAEVQLVPCLHGRGVIGSLMAHGVGYSIRWPDQPSIYLTGDTILSPELEAFVVQQQPDIIVAPAGGARFDVGGEIIMGVDDILGLLRIAKGRVVANHLEALDHCPVSRRQLRDAADSAGLGQRLLIPDDGQCINLSDASLAGAA